MTASSAPPTSRSGPVIVIGAGIGGLAAALPLVHAGADVTVLDRHSAPGGKMRQIDGVDAGPTVLTMRQVFDDLFEQSGEALDQHVRLIPQEILARHWWPGSGAFDLFFDEIRNTESVRDFFGDRAAQEFEAFNDRAKTLFKGFHAPVMTAPELSFPRLTQHVLSTPSLIPAMAPLSTLASLLDRSFSDARLRQLFGRYATYVGGSPYASPALLALIWQAEAQGVWCVQGGMHILAKTIARLIEAKGGRLRYNSDVREILTDSDGVTGVMLASGEVLTTSHVIFNGDPRALGLGLLGEAVQTAARKPLQAKRSLSATVWSFSSAVSGPDLLHHNVFFCGDPREEFGAIKAGRLPKDATLYVCAEDRGQGIPLPEVERFEIIRNAPPLTAGISTPRDYSICQTQTFKALETFGLRFQTHPMPHHMTGPEGFEALFPGSAGSLYGQTPHGMTAALSRPTARTPIPGLILCGGGCHPGAGVPMSALSGRHAAEAIMTDRTSTLPSRRMDTPGGMSTESAPVAHAPSASLRS